MVNKEQIVKRFAEFMYKKLDDMSIKSPIVLVLRPAFHKVIDKITCKFDKYLGFIADENGMIDIAAMIDEMINNLVTANVKEYPDFLNGVTIGNGKIIVNVPFINKQLVFDKSDLNELKSFIIR